MPRACGIAASSRSRASTSAPASRSRTTKKWGTVVQLWVVRSAISRPIELGVSTPLGADVVADEDKLFDLAAAKTSEARISPPDPDPRTLVMSTPCSLASRRALGEIWVPAGLAAEITGEEAFGGGAGLWI